MALGSASQDKLATAVTKTTQELAAQDAALLVANFEKMATGAEGAKPHSKNWPSLNFGDVRGVSASTCKRCMNWRPRGN